MIHCSSPDAHDPVFDLVQGPVKCPNPECEGGMVPLGRIEVYCLVCKGEPILTNESDIADVFAWAIPRRITVELYESEAD